MVVFLWRCSGRQIRAALSVSLAVQKRILERCQRLEQTHLNKVHLASFSLHPFSLFPLLKKFPLPLIQRTANSTDYFQEVSMKNFSCWSKSTPSSKERLLPSSGRWLEDESEEGSSVTAKRVERKQ